MSVQTIGQAVRREEDPRLLKGKGRYVDDIKAPNEARGHVLRSPHAHARIRSIDTGQALAAPGVLAILVGDDLRRRGLGTLRPLVPRKRRDGSRAFVCPQPILAQEFVRYVGDPVAFVVAENREQARDAAELVAVDYRVLPAVVDASAALLDGAPLLWEEAPGNLCFRFERGDREAVAAAMAKAAHIVEIELVNNRLVVAPIEPRAAIGNYDSATDSFDLALTGQGVHSLRNQLANSVFHMPPERIRVSAPDVGGGFGVKNFLYPEWVLLLWAARRLGRPVRWLAERGEEFLSSAQARDNHTKGRLALDAEGRFLALDVATVADLGAYLSTNGPGNSTNSPSTAMGGVYAIPAMFMSVRGAFTNTVPVDAYRGAGKPEANYLIERLVELAGRRLGIDPTELRRRNLIREFPHRRPFGIVIDSGKFAANLDAAAGRVLGWKKPEAPGRLSGLGIACFLETARGAPNEGAEIRFETDGAVSLMLGTQRAGARDELSPDRRRPARPADRELPLCPGRYARGARRQWTWRRALDAPGRLCPLPRGRDGHRQGTQRRRWLVAGGSCRAGLRRRALHGTRQRARDRSAGGGARRRRPGEPARRACAGARQLRLE
jgi:carbon-monoxide dehydrogenase large subunit